MLPVQQAQSFGDIRMEGHGNSLIINQVVQIAVAEIKTRAFNPSSPYLGLNRFEERHRALFYGRDALVAELLAAVTHGTLTIVAGGSGSGKSSVVRAGLLPQLAERLPKDRFRSLIFTPDRNPFASLQSSLIAAGYTQAQAEPARSESAETLVRLSTDLRRPDELWLVFVDQFEEIFTLCTDPGVRTAFIQGLVRLARAQQQEVKLVLAMRADFLDRFGPYADMAALTQSNLRLVADMQPGELREVIEQPAARHGVIFEEGLVERIIRDVQGRPGALPLLEYTLDLLWREDSPADDRALNVETYGRLGGIEGALRKRADELYGFADSLKSRPRSSEQQAAIRRVFLRLVEFSGGAADGRAVSRRTRRGEFGSELEQQMLDELIREKLLFSNAAQSSAATVELAHEALLSAWPLLREWIDQVRQVLFVRNLLSTDARKWGEIKALSQKRAQEELWSGGRLVQALDMQARGDFLALLGGLTPIEEEFLVASQALREQRIWEDEARLRQRQRLQRTGAAILMLLVLLMSGVAFFTRMQQKEADSQRRRAEQLQQNAERQNQENERRVLDGYVEQGRYLLAEKDQPAHALLWLQRAYAGGSRHPMLPYLLGDAARPVQSVIAIKPEPAPSELSALSAESEYRIDTEEPGVAKVKKSADGKVVAVLKGPFELGGNPHVTPDGERILTGARDGSVQLWAFPSGKLLQVFQGHIGSIRRIGTSQDGKRVYTAGYDRTVRFWDLETGALLSTLDFDLDGWVFFDSRSGRLLSTRRPQLLELDGALAERRVHVQAFPSAVNSASYRTDGSRIVSSLADGTIQVWESASGRVLRTLSNGGVGVMWAAFSPDGRRIVSGDEQGDAQIWDAESGARLRKLSGHERAIRTACFSPDGHRIATASHDGTTRLWNSKEGSLLLTLRGHAKAVLDVSFSPDGQRIVTTSNDRTARLWDVEKGSVLLTLHSTHIAPFSGASFSPDGKRILTSDAQQRAEVWDATSGKRLLELHGHSGVVWSARFSPTGDRIVTTGEDRTARIWDAQSGRVLAILRGHGGPVSTAEWAADGKKLVTTSHDHTARIWELQPETRSASELAALIHDRLGFRLEGDVVVRTDVAPAARSYVDLTLRVDALKKQGPALVQWGDVLRSGDKLSFSVETDRNAYVYIAVVPSQGAPEFIFPRAGDEQVSSVRQLRIPKNPEKWIILDRGTGEEHFLAYASIEPIAAAELIRMALADTRAIRSSAQPVRTMGERFMIRHR